MTKPEQRALGASGVTVPAIGVGTLSWGDRRFGYGKTHTRANVFAAYKTCLDAGLNYFDTSENYGGGMTEQLLGEFHHEDGRPIMVGTKFSPATIFEPSNRFSPASVIPTLDGSLKRLGLKQVDLYQMHSAPPQRKLDAFLDAFAETVKSGRVRAVGVSNFTVGQVRYAHDYFARHGIALASNETGYNLLYRYPETSGMLKLCDELDMALIAYLPLSEGILTGKYRVGGAPYPFILQVLFKIGQINDPSRRADYTLLQRLFTRAPELKRETLEPLFVVLDEIAKTHRKTIPQVALNWLLTSSPRVIPIPGPKNARQALSNAGALGWRLTPEEHNRIARTEAAI